MRFNPGELAYNRQRNALRKLRGYGVDAKQKALLDNAGIPRL